MTAPPSRCVIGINPGHDGAVAILDGGDLVASLEAEKDSFDRHAPVGAELLLQAFALAPGPVDVIAVGGWHKYLPGHAGGIGAGYRGLEPGAAVPGWHAGRPVLRHTSSHERSHILGGVAMSPFSPDDDLAVLVWEGVIGAFYEWRNGGSTLVRHPVLDQPGDRFAALFALADPGFSGKAFINPSVAGKLMAIAGCADDLPPSEDSQHVVRNLLSMATVQPFVKDRFRRSPLHDAGVTDPEVARAGRLLADEIFATFLASARSDLPPGLPLVISGGCGLNCEWNSAWDDCGWFSEVFVPPTANDSGSAIGTAVDGWVATGGRPSITWDVYRGAEFVVDVPAPAGWVERAVDERKLSAAIASGTVVAWVQGRCEIGPRALGHRSLLASATSAASRVALNTLKRREDYRPIAPVCLEEDLERWFDRHTPDPYMLRFRRVRDPVALPGVTHVDGTARVQSVTRQSCAPLYDLLCAHRAGTGVGVLCNTSLNHLGKGFLNRMSELLGYCDLVGIDDIVVGRRWLTRAGTRTAGP